MIIADGILSSLLGFSILLCRASVVGRVSGSLHGQRGRGGSFIVFNPKKRHSRTTRLRNQATSDCSSCSNSEVLGVNGFPSHDDSLLRTTYSLAAVELLDRPEV